MQTCEHCGDMLPQVGMTVVLCSCEGTRQAELEERQRRMLWRRDRAQAQAEQEKARRNRRRKVSLGA